MRRPRCPTCRTPVEWAGHALRPFCSLRCKLVDLGTWLDEGYRLPALIQDEAEIVAAPEGGDEASTP